MKKHLTAWLFITSAIGIAFFNNPPEGRTGAPGEQSCSSGGCHNSGGANHTANVAISGFPGVLNGGETYTINLTASHGGTIPANPRLGFQLVVLDENNDNIGSLSNPAPQASLTSSGGRTYAEHNPGQNSSNTTWTIDFTAPASSSSQQVTVYATANVANGNGNSGGDIIREVTMSAGLQATSDPLIVDVIKINDVLCNGEDSGSAEVIASGGPTGNYTYEWDNGETNAVATMLNARLHTVTVSDQSEIVVESILINEPELLEGRITDQQNPSCNDVRNGSITVEAEGGTEPYSFEWNTGATGRELRNVFGGDYSVTITDANDCTTELNATLETPDPIILNFETDPPLCHDSADGTIRVAGTGGTGPILYEWDNGETGDVLSNLSGGTYTVMAMDDNGCLLEESVELIAPDPLLIILEADNINCAGDTLAGITAVISGGTGDLSLDWSTGSDSLNSGPVGAGIYSLTVTDENACIAETELEIQEPQALNIFTDSRAPFCPNDSTGFIILNPSG
ncbi:MAG TPA: choice-of-anchor V domain-containing protein, partial [Saprospiraceae bacterium]|nr:choice-of-anchor V domain-containing protein [Saprospiraceae bacterium]